MDLVPTVISSTPPGIKNIHLSSTLPLRMSGFRSDRPANCKRVGDRLSRPPPTIFEPLPLGDRHARGHGQYRPRSRQQSSQDSRPLVGARLL